MSGVSRLEALEIFTNPNDLEVLITEDKKSKKYGVVFCRGPGHNFKLMLDADPYTENFEEILEAVKTTLETVQQGITKELEDPASFTAQFLNPDNQAIDQSKALNPELINQIINELRQHKIASTYKMKAKAAAS
jgi:hypothetical protein